MCIRDRNQGATNVEIDKESIRDFEKLEMCIRDSLGTPEEVARTLVFLAGRGAGFITGQVLGVNGGIVI